MVKSAERIENLAYLERRAERLRAGFTTLDHDENMDRFRRLLTRPGPDGSLANFQAFRLLFESHIAGIVLTAHPTFSLSNGARECLEGLLRGEAAAPPSILYPDVSPSLDDELDQSFAAMVNLRAAVRLLFEEAIEYAAQTYPDHWRDFTPGFVTLASWVGYDLDGRTDISWLTSLRYRYLNALSGLDEYDALVKRVALAHPAWEALCDGLAVFRESFELGLSVLDDSGGGREGLAELNRLAVDRQKEKEHAIDQINAALRDLMSSDLSNQQLRDISLLRAEWNMMGLGYNHIHFRLNAAQLHNAIRSEIALERAPDKSTSRRKYLADISALLDEVVPVNIHYGDVSQEGTTAKRLFMLAAQFEKHFDRHTPIRLLVAESDTPFTLLTALYYARLFGVDDHVEISPLFETVAGLERGDRVIAELLDSQHFLDYLRCQKRFCIQFGFSDSGRFIGQPAATLAIERFKVRLIDLWHQRGLEDIQLLFFDTHGESLGRGAHPDGLQARFAYLHPPLVRQKLARMDAPYKQEVSFQGGDGYLWLANKDQAFSVMVDFLAVRLQDFDAAGDYLYQESDWALDFFLTLKEFQDNLVNHPGYMALMDAFAPGFMFPTGSRAVVRQGGGGPDDRNRDVSRMRAIPHNAILQQLGYMANTLGGFGNAVARSPEQYEEVLCASGRLSSISSLVNAARVRSNISHIAAYADMIAPERWIAMAKDEKDADRRENMLRLSKVLAKSFDVDAIDDLLRKLQRDSVRFDAWCKSPMRSDDVSERLDRLHSERIELLSDLYLLAMEIPQFSPRSDVSLDGLVTSLLRLEVEPALAQLRDIFPIVPPPDDDVAFGEASTYGGIPGGYHRLHERIFDPISQLHDRMLDISARIALEIGAIG